MPAVFVEAMAYLRVHAIAPAMCLTNVVYVVETASQLELVTVLARFLLRITIAQETAWSTRTAMACVMPWKYSAARMRPIQVTMQEPRKMTALAW
jgi:hypothetical protein